jgi:hypothetical protein
MKTTKPMLEYLATCSKTSLESFELARLNDRANLRKHMIELLDELIEVEIQARVAEWALRHRRNRATADRPPRRARRSGSPELTGTPLTLFANHSTDNAGGPDFADAAPSPIIASGAVRPLVSPTCLRRSVLLAAERSKRIA